MLRAQKWPRALIVLGILLACCSCASASDPSLDISQYAHTAWTVRGGSFKGVIWSIAQTPDGYLWLGTEFGLLRFDGARSVPWQPPAGEQLPSNYIRSLLATHDGTLWIGTTKGLASWKDGKLAHYPEVDGDVHELLGDREGTVWVGLWSPSSGEVCAIRSGNTQCYGKEGSFRDGVFSLYEDSAGNLWVVTGTGLWRWKPGPPKFYALAGMRSATALAEDTDGALLVGWNGRIHRVVDGKIEAYSLPGIGREFQAHKLLRDRTGGLWIGTRDRGLLHVHQGQTDVFARSDGLSDDFVRSLFEDREGNIWVATISGLDRFRDLAVPTISVKQGLTNGYIWSVLAARDGSIWLATYGGLNRWKDGQVTIYRKRSAHFPSRTRGDGEREVREVVDGGLPEDDADSLFQDNRGRIWVTTDHGGAYFENGRFIPVPAFTGESSPAIAGDLAGNLWISDPGSGLVHVRDGKVIERITWESTGRKDWAFALVHDPVQGGLWLGFYQSGVGYFKDGQIRASYGAADGLGKGRVTGLQLDADGTLWAATQGGLSRVKNGRVATLTTENGLPCSAVDWVMEDDVHSFWLGMGCGLVRVARTELEAWATDSKRAIQVTVFDSSDGVRSYASVGGNSPRVAKSTDGRLWFLPYDGVSVVDPLHLPFNKLLPPVHIEQIIADRHNYDASSEVRLPPLVRDLEIDYTALSLVAPEKVLFRYKLEGRDRDWQNVGNRRQAFYTDLAPGNYRFRVAACNNSGVWNEAGTFMDFFIAPAYYQTALFRTLCAAAVLALLWAGYRMRVRQLRRQQRKLRDVIETIPTFAWTALPDGSVNFVNHNWVKYTGLTAEETSGSGWRAAVHNEDLERHAEKWQASLQSGKPFESELRYRRAADEQYRWFLVRAVPLRDARGKIVEWYGTSTDIEDRKRAEQLQAELSHMNRVSMMGELSASLAHEIKQPIAAALTNAKTGLRWLARDPADVQEARAAITRVVNDGTRAAEIINHLRCFYKKAGPAERELVDINEVAREMLPLLNSEAIRYSVSMRTDLAAELPKTKADRVQLQQVFMNLMLNGIEAMKDTGGELTIKSEQTEDDRLRISISDRGVGLPSEEAGHIFDAFFTTKSQGTGMGLTITRSIIEAHGGRLWASANNGQGATFHFTLPIEATGSSTSTV